MNDYVNITSIERPKRASRTVNCSGGDNAGGQSQVDRSLRYHARERFIYLAANAARDVIKVGSSCNPKSRTVHMFLGSFLLPVPGVTLPRIWRFRLVQSWPIGVITYTQAVAIEYAVHKMLRAVASQYVTEWYRLDADTATAAIEQFLIDRKAVA